MIARDPLFHSIAAFFIPLTSESLQPVEKNTSTNARSRNVRQAFLTVSISMGDKALGNRRSCFYVLIFSAGLCNSNSSRTSQAKKAFITDNFFDIVLFFKLGLSAK